MTKVVKWGEIKKGFPMGNRINGRRFNPKRYRIVLGDDGKRHLFVSFKLRGGWLYIK
jgi:hypothetical protein